jgi:putative intracellular protease/amidase
VLVVLSGAKHLDLRDGKVYPTGYYLSFIQGFEALSHPQSLSSIAKGGGREFVGLFLPSGHAPMQDHLKNRDLGAILCSFHETGRPTGIICHGPVVLLSASPDPEAYDRALVAGDANALRDLSRNWTYAGYRVTVFSTAEEQQIEASRMHGNVLFYPDEALAKAGAIVQNAPAWQSHVIEDRELVTGQQPFSDHAFGDALVLQSRSVRSALDGIDTSGILASL